MPMTDTNLKQKADELWYFFENNLFVNDGVYSYNTNLVFAFADYIDNLSDADLSDFLHTSDADTIQHFRQMINHAIDRWLSDFAKTVAIM